jgi:hypothetical protein
LTNGNLPQATVQTPFQITLTTYGGVGNISFSLISQPSWLTVSNNVLSGTPTATGTFTFSIYLQDQMGNNATIQKSLTVVGSSASTGSTTSSNQSLQQAIIALQNSGSADEDQSVFINHLSILSNVSSTCVLKSTDKEVSGSSNIISVSASRLQLTLMSGKVLVLQQCTTRQFSDSVKIRDFQVGNSVEWVGIADSQPDRFLATKIIKTAD